MEFTQRLFMAVNGGLPTVLAFELLAEGRGRLRRVGRAVADSLRNGETLRSALLSVHPPVPLFIVVSLAAGDAGGKTAKTLNRVLTYYEERLEIRRAIIRQVTYFILLIVVAQYVIPFVRGFVLATDPAEVYMLRFIWHLWDDAATIAAVCLLIALINRVRPLQFVVAFFLSNVWPVARIVRNLAIARFFSILAILLDAGLPYAKAVKLAVPTAKNPAVEWSLRDVPGLIVDGVPLSEALARSRYVSREIIQQLKTGEHTGLPERMLERLARDLHASARHPVTIFISILEILLIVGFGLMFAFSAT